MCVNKLYSYAALLPPAVRRRRLDLCLFQESVKRRHDRREGLPHGGHVGLDLGGVAERRGAVQAAHALSDLERFDGVVAGADRSYSGGRGTSEERGPEERSDHRAISDQR